MKFSYKTLGFFLLLCSCGEHTQESKVTEIIFDKPIQNTHHFYLYYKYENMVCEKGVLEGNWCKIKVEPTENRFVLKNFLHAGKEYALGISYCEGESTNSCNLYQTNLSQKEGECGYRLSSFTEGSHIALVKACKEEVIQKEGALTHEISLDKTQIVFEVPPLKENETLCILSGNQNIPLGVKLEFGYVSKASQLTQEDREYLKKESKINDSQIPNSFEAQNRTQHHCEEFENNSTQIKCKLPPNYQNAHFYIGYVKTNGIAHGICYLTSHLKYFFNVNFENWFGVQKSYWSKTWNKEDSIVLKKKQ